MSVEELWFDVGLKTYTRRSGIFGDKGLLWFDVGLKTYTRYCQEFASYIRCGLM